MRDSFFARLCAPALVLAVLLAAPAVGQGLQNVSPTLDEPELPQLPTIRTPLPQSRPTLIRPPQDDNDGPKLQTTTGPALTPIDAAQPLAAENATPADPQGQPGDALVLQAYELTHTADSYEQLTEVVQLCVQAIRAGLAEEGAAYARDLSAWAFNRRGEILAAEGKEREALADFEKAVQIDPMRWQAFHNRGISYALQQRYTEAIQDFNRVVKLKPDHANVYFNRGEVRYEMGQFESAIDNYAMALQLNPQDAASLNSRGHSYYRLGDYRRAAADFTAAIKIEPNNAAALTNRGDLFADLGYYERALTDYRAAIQHDPQMPRAYQSAAWLLATCPDERFRSVNGSLQAAQRAVQLDTSGDHRYLDTLAAAQANAGQYDAARKTVARAMQAAGPEGASLYQGRLALYSRNQPLRTQARELPQVASERPQPEGQPTSFEQPIESAVQILDSEPAAEAEPATASAPAAESAAAIAE